ncbi:hypothetical protein [Psychromicrobium xiongbiense]|uniref:hypothetical protein n=1 Tax=Psychromicrobium xiongbiense TaxID=3051184 RepID=UPI002556E356|nr:hypothetical protein [Psychromicrobium sp. YIM S02556]
MRLPKPRRTHVAKILRRSLLGLGLGIAWFALSGQAANAADHTDGLIPDISSTLSSTIHQVSGAVTPVTQVVSGTVSRMETIAPPVQPVIQQVAQIASSPTVASVQTLVTSTTHLASNTVSATTSAVTTVLNSTTTALQPVTQGTILQPVVSVTTGTVDGLLGSTSQSVSGLLPQIPSTIPTVSSLLPGGTTAGQGETGTLPVNSVPSGSVPQASAAAGVPGDSKVLTPTASSTDSIQAMATSRLSSFAPQLASAAHLEAQDGASGTQVPLYPSPRGAPDAPWVAPSTSSSSSANNGSSGGTSSFAAVPNDFFLLFDVQNGRGAVSSRLTPAAPTFDPGSTPD